MAQQESNGLARWQVWASIISAVLLINGAVITYVVQIADVRSDTVQNKEAIDEASRRLDKLEDASANNRLEIVKAQLSQVEIDSQLRASIDDSNKSLAWQLRMDSMLFDMASNHKIHLPTDNAFYPNIADGASR